MLRSNKVILVSHCVLNQNAVVKPLARDKGAFKTIIDLIMDSGYGVVQLSCPETLMFGMNRPPMTKLEYETPDYIKLCSDLAAHDMTLVQRFISGNINVAGIVGIDQSPTCSQFNDKGHYMMALGRFEAIENLPKIDIPETYEVGTNSAEAFHEQFKLWLSHL